MDWLPDLSEEDTEILVKIVKAAQGRKVEGMKGEWKQFLKSESGKAPSVSHDPARHSWTTLVAFIKTFTQEADKQMVRQRIGAVKRAKRIKEFKGKCSPAQALVELTSQHWRYQEYYTFPSTTEGWVTTEQNKENNSNDHEHMLSVDCEMVLCEDGEREVVRVCIVNSDCKTVLDMFVKPRKAVIDYLTPITGISEADLENVTSNLFDVQAAILELLTSSTILVGHSLHNDLKALKIDHLRVIDTSLIFQYQNRPDSYSAGLNSLCKAVLGYHFRDEEAPHDCLRDAIIPMQIVLNTLEHGLNRAIIIEEKKLDEGQLCKLYLHGIPRTVSMEDLKKIFPKRYSVNVEEIAWTKSNRGTTFVIFKSRDDANKAFKKLKGLLGQDSYGRPQKSLLISVVGTDGRRMEIPIKVRKMLSIFSEHLTLNNVSVEVCESVSPKRMKLMDGNSQMDNCCGDIEEVKSLRNQLKLKTEEVQAFQKTILDLTREQM